MRIKCDLESCEFIENGECPLSNYGRESMCCLGK